MTSKIIQSVKWLSSAGLMAGALMASQPAQADLIYDSTVRLPAQGFGNVPRALTVQDPGNSPTPPGIESGCVSAGSGGAFLAGPDACISDADVTDNNGVTNVGGDEVSPTADNQKFGIPTLDELNYDDAADIRILFNPAEPQSGPNASILVEDLTLKFLLDGELLAAVDTPDGGVEFETTDPGVGVAGFVFRISDDELDDLDSIFALANFGDVRLALETTLADTHGGPDSFSFVAARSGGGTGGEVPEPAALGLFGFGLLGLGALRRRKA